jgi:hypothetical protein
MNLLERFLGQKQTKIGGCLVERRQLKRFSDTVSPEVRVKGGESFIDQEYCISYKISCEVSHYKKHSVLISTEVDLEMKYELVRE